MPKKLHHRTDYRKHRGAAYPPVGDALDAIAKGFRALAEGKPLPAETLAWIEACEAVKATYRKPKGS